MRQIISDLCDLLREQKAVLTNMLELAKEERQVIINGHSDKLEDIIRQELRELSKLGSVEKKRLTLHKTIAVQINIPEEDLTVSKIADNVDADEREVIKTLQSELTQIIEEHSALNMENRQLIKAHIEYSETMLELMVGAEDPLNNMYGGDGKSTSERKRNTGFYDGHA